MLQVMVKRVAQKFTVVRKLLLPPMVNLFETINGKEAIYGENFGGQENNITIQQQDHFMT